MSANEIGYSLISKQKTGVRSSFSFEETVWSQVFELHLPFLSLFSGLVSHFGEVLSMSF